MASRHSKKPTADELEIARRTTDETEIAADHYTKIIAAGSPYETVDWAGSDHTANMAYVAQEAINVGLRVTGDVSFVKAEPNPKAPDTSTLLTYTAPAIPAYRVGSAMAPVPGQPDNEVEPDDTVSPRDVIDESEDGSNHFEDAE